MTNRPNFSSEPKGLKKLLGTPGVRPALLGGCVALAMLAVAAVALSAPDVKDKLPAVLEEQIQWGSEQDGEDENYNMADKLDAADYVGTILPQTEDAGQAYLDETLFIGDSNTMRYMMYGPEDSEEPFTTIDNNIGVVSMGVQQITSLKCENFVGRASAVTIPEAVKIMQPRRIIIGFGTNNLSMNTDDYIAKYRDGLYAIEEAYPYTDIIVCAVPPLDQQRSNTALTMNKVDSFNAALAEMCEQEGYKFLDTSEALEDPSTGWAKTDYTLSDGVHLSQAGVRALFDYIRTHAYITEDRRPKPLNEIPAVKGVTPNLIEKDPIAVRGSDDEDEDEETNSLGKKVPVEFTAGEGGSIKGKTTQLVLRGELCDTIVAQAEDGWEFDYWTATIGSTGNSAETLTFRVPGNADANGVVLKAHFKRVEASPSPTAAPSATPTKAPAATPTKAPAATPTAAPAATPTAAPTATPTVVPTATPTAAPTATPTVAPTATPTAAPTATPTAAPTATPPSAQSQVTESEEQPQG